MGGNVLAVTGGKGGVGKSTTTINLGVSLRLDGYSVVVVDADVEMPNLMEMLDLEASTTIHDVLSGSAEPMEAIVEVGDGFAAIPGDPALSGYGTIEPERLNVVVDTLAARYDWVLLDTGAGLSYDDILPLAIADEIIVVSSTDPAAVENAKRTQAFVQQLNRSVNGIVLTKANPVFLDSIAEEFDAEILAVIPKEDVVNRSTVEGRPLELIAPQSGAAKAYRRLEATITDGQLPPARRVESETQDEAEAEVDEAEEEGASEPADDAGGVVREPPSPAKRGLFGRIASLLS